MEEENVQNSSSKAKASRRGGRKKRKDNLLNNESTDNDHLNKTEEAGASTDSITDETNNVNRQRSKSKEKNSNSSKKETQSTESSKSRKGNNHSHDENSTSETKDASASINPITDKKNRQRSKSRDKDVNASKKENQNIDTYSREGNLSSKQKTEEDVTFVTPITDKKNKRRNKSKENNFNKKENQNIDTYSSKLKSDEGYLSTNQKGKNSSEQYNQDYPSIQSKKEGLSNETEEASASITVETDVKKRQRSKSREKNLSTDSQNKDSDPWNRKFEHKNDRVDRRGRNNEEQRYFQDRNKYRNDEKDNFSASSYPKNTSRFYSNKSRYNSNEQDKSHGYSKDSAGGNVLYNTPSLDTEQSWETNASVNLNTDKRDSQNTDSDSKDFRYPEESTRQPGSYAKPRGKFNQEQRFNKTNRGRQYKEDKSHGYSKDSAGGNVLYNTPSLDTEESWETSASMNLNTDKKDSQNTDSDSKDFRYPEDSTRQPGSYARPHGKIYQEQRFNKPNKDRQFNQYGQKKPHEYSKSPLDNEEWSSNDTSEPSVSVNYISDITDDKNRQRSKSREKRFNTDKRYNQNTDSRNFRSFERGTRQKEHFGARRGRFNPERNNYNNERNEWNDEEKQEIKFNELFKFKEKNGDLFTASKEYCLAHCVAEDFRMGAGIAVTFRKTFHRVEELLSQYKKTGEVAVLSDSNRFIYYLVTKKYSYEKPTYRTLESSLREMKLHCVENSVKKLAMPKIGCGLDLLEWNRVEKTIRNLFGDMEIEIVVYNYQKDETEITVVSKPLKQAYVQHGVYEFTKIDPDFGLLFLCYEDDFITETIQSLDKGNRIIYDLKRERKTTGDVVRIHKSNYVYYGLVIGKVHENKNNHFDRFNFTAFGNCLRKLRNHNKKDGFINFSIEPYFCDSDDVLMHKIVTLLKTLLPDVTVCVCWPEHLKDECSKYTMNND